MHDKKYLPAHIANYFIWKADQDKIEDLTSMKLIKLVYFSYAWHYAIFNKKLFTEKIEAWRYGPVIPSIYHEFKRFGNSKVGLYSIDFEPESNNVSYPIVSQNDEDALNIVGTIWEIYKKYSGWELSKITHDGKPWKSAFAEGENTPMKDEEIAKRGQEAILKHQENTTNNEKRPRP